MQSTGNIRFDYSDEDVRQRVASFLMTRHYPAFRDLSVDVQHGAVTLSGAVCSFHEKQVALNTCRRVAGVLTLIDEIEVDSAAEVCLLEFHPA